MSSRIRVSLALFSILGLLATAGSAWVHLGLLRSPTLSSVCDISAIISCTDAYRSEYGTVFGVPVALFGLCWFAGILLMLAGESLAGVPASANVPVYVFALSAPALLFSLYLAQASFVVLKVVCLLCLATYVAVAAIFIISGISTRFSMNTLSTRILRDAQSLKARPAAVAMIVIFLAGSIGLLGFFPKEGGGPLIPTPSAMTPSAPATPDPAPSAAGATASPAQAAAQPPEEVAVAQYLASRRKVNMMGDTGGAAVVVVKFNDYQCPPCNQTYTMYKPLKQEWEKKAPGKVRFVTQDFPLEPECNANVKQTIHPIACEAAAAVRMARAKGKSDQLEDWIFANQQTLTLDGLKKAVRDVGGVGDFDAQYPRVLNDVKTDASLGGFYGVHSTPTFFVNGMQIEALRKEALDAVIAYELKRASTAK